MRARRRRRRAAQRQDAKGASRTWLPWWGWLALLTLGAAVLAARTLL